MKRPKIRPPGPSRIKAPIGKMVRAQPADARNAALQAAFDAATEYNIANNNFTDCLTNYNEALDLWNARNGNMTPGDREACLQHLNDACSALLSMEDYVVLAEGFIFAGDALFDEAEGMPNNPLMHKVAKYNASKDRYDTSIQRSESANGILTTFEPELNSAMNILNTYGRSK